MDKGEYHEKVDFSNTIQKVSLQSSYENIYYTLCDKTRPDKTTTLRFSAGLHVRLLDFLLFIYYLSIHLFTYQLRCLKDLKHLSISAHTDEQYVIKGLPVTIEDILLTQMLYIHFFIMISMTF